MLSKVNYDSINYGTDKIKEYCKTYNNVIRIQDNLIDSLLIETNQHIYIFNYKNNKIYYHNRIQIEFNNKKIIKQIDSFDQNNIMIAPKIRKHVLTQCYDCEIILGIGGEYYLYFLFINAKKYYGMSNHNCIINDANINIPYSINYLVDYNNLNSYPIIKKSNIILLNVSNIHHNIILYISQLYFDKFIIITCNLNNKKILLLQKYFRIIKIKTFNNFNGYIKILSLLKKNINYIKYVY